MQITRQLAWAAATDAGNRSMRNAGGSLWSEEDFTAAAVEFSRLWPAEQCPKCGGDGVARSEHGNAVDDACPACQGTGKEVA